MSNFQEHKDLIAQYTTTIDDAALQGLVKTYALVMMKADSRCVSCSDATEKQTVRENFLKKKLGLTLSDAELDVAIEEVCKTMQAERFKSRITFYYLLAEKYGQLAQFA
jgi:hypothetical protein